ncbi:MAG: periplasmic heavy metal sensor [Rhodobacteraceae bacterium]|nr:periplasmic heavy metal sensor [Paracoccaceae bacterium]
MAGTDEGGAAGAAGTPGAPRWMRVALVVSLAANLLVAGVVVGAMLHGPDGGPRGAIGDIGLGPFTGAFAPEDRRAMRDDFLARAADFRAMRDREHADFAAVLAALRAEPFDRAALEAALGSLRDRLAQRMDLGRDIMLDRLSAMTPAARAAFADRLEEMLRHPRHGGPGGDGD